MDDLRARIGVEIERLAFLEAVHYGVRIDGKKTRGFVEILRAAGLDGDTALDVVDAAVAEGSETGLLRYQADHPACEAAAGLVNATVLRSKKFLPRTPLLGHWLYPGDRMLLHGPRGSGKSHLAMSIGLAIAAGPEGPGLLGWTAPVAQSVLYLDFELGARKLKAILEGCERATHPATPVSCLLDFYPNHPRLHDSDDLKRLDDLIASVEPAVLIVDSQTFAFSVDSENDAAQWAPYNDWLNRLAGRGITYLGIGHDGRNEGHCRGSSAREDSLDLVLGLERKGKTAAGIDVALKWSKTRGLAPGDVETLRVRLGTPDGPEDSAPIWTWSRDDDAELDSRAEQVRRLNSEGVTQIEIMSRLGMKRTAVQRALSRGEK